jgi:hypothetical protein
VAQSRGAARRLPARGVWLQFGLGGAVSGGVGPCRAEWGPKKWPRAGSWATRTGTVSSLFLPTAKHMKKCVMPLTCLLHPEDAVTGFPIARQGSGAVGQSVGRGNVMLESPNSRLLSFPFPIKTSPSSVSRLPLPHSNSPFRCQFPHGRGVNHAGAGAQRKVQGLSTTRAGVPI